VCLGADVSPQSTSFQHALAVVVASVAAHKMRCSQPPACAGLHLHITADRAMASGFRRWAYHLVRRLRRESRRGSSFLRHPLPSTRVRNRAKTNRSAGEGGPRVEGPEGLADIVYTHLSKKNKKKPHDLISYKINIKQAASA
jgi:hypothetical protein